MSQISRSVISVEVLAEGHYGLGKMGMEDLVALVEGGVARIETIEVVANFTATKAAQAGLVDFYEEAKEELERRAKLESKRERMLRLRDEADGIEHELAKAGVLDREL